MTSHSSDNLAFSFDQEGNVFLHRKNIDDDTKPMLTMELKKFEVLVFLESLLDDPMLQERAITVLENKRLINLPPNSSKGDIIQ